MKKETKREILKTWENLNSFVITAGENDCRELLRAELAGKRRSQFAMRIYSRLNRVRAARERGELRSKLGVL